MLKIFALLFFLVPTFSFAETILDKPFRIFNCSISSIYKNHIDDLVRNKIKIISECMKNDDRWRCEDRYERELQSYQIKIDSGNRVMQTWNWAGTEYQIYPWEDEGKILSKTEWLYGLTTKFKVSYGAGSTNSPPAIGFNHMYNFYFKDDQANDPITNDIVDINIFHAKERLYPTAFVTQRISFANSWQSSLQLECQFDNNLIH